MAILNTLYAGQGVSSSGGTITGDLTISGDLTVSGGGDFSYSEVLTGDMKITNTAATAGLHIDQDGAHYGIQVDSEAANYSAAYFTGKYGLDCVQDVSSGFSARFSRNIAEAGSLPCVEIIDDHTSNTQTTFKVRQDGTGDILNLFDGATEVFTVLDGGSVGIGTATSPHGGVGQAKLAIEGTNANAAGPHIQYTTASDDYPLFQQLNWTHDNVHMFFDAYYDGAEKSSDAGSNFAISKVGDVLKFRYDSGIAAGSSLTWNDGLVLNTSGNVGIGNSAPAAFLHVGSPSTASDVAIFIDVDNASTYTPALKLGWDGTPVAELDMQFDTRATTGFKIGTLNSYPMSFVINDVTKMYIDGSTGNVGIGTATISNYDNIGIGDTGEQLVIQHTGGGDPATIQIAKYSGTDNMGGETVGKLSFLSFPATTAVATAEIVAYTGSGDSDASEGNLVFYTATGSTSTERMRIDSSGNVGIGVVPEAWNSGYDGLQIGNTGSIAGYATSGIDRMWITANGYVDTSDGYWQYINTDTASQYEQRDGVHNFFTAVSGSADATITWVKNMVLDANSRISLSNNDAGTSNTTFGKLAGAALASGGNYNVLIGEDAGNDLTTGERNVVVGFGALDRGTTESDDNVAIGWEALHGNHTIAAVNDCVAVGSQAIGTGTLTAAASGSVGIGHNALSALTSGASNLAVGHNALAELTTGGHNLAIGTGVLQHCDEGGANIGIGAGALDDWDSGSTVDGSVHNLMIGVDAGGGAWANAVSAYNVGIGNYVMDAIMDGSLYNTAVGYNGLSALTTGDGNTCVGYQSGEDTTDGGYNTIVGYQAGKELISTNHNTAIGTAALRDSTLVDQTVVIGSNAGMGAMTAAADGTIAIGFQALTALTSGAGNTAVGYLAATDITTGVGNTVVGHEALTNAQVNVSSTTAIGYRAGYKLGDDGASDHSEKNTLVGYLAMGGGHDTVANNTGHENVAIGTNALGGATAVDVAVTASFNVAIGQDTMRVVQTGGSNVAIGKESGGAITTGSSNVSLGKGAGGTITTGSSNTLIGYEADADAATDSYQTRIGHYGALRYMTAQITMADFTNAGADNRVASGDGTSGSLLKIPQYGFLKRVTCTVVTASGGTGIFNISIGTSHEPVGDGITGRVELIGAGAADGDGTTSRTQAADAAGDTNLDIVTAKYVHIWEANQATDNCAGWMAADNYLYVCHAGTGNGTNATNAVLRITAEYFGED